MLTHLLSDKPFCLDMRLFDLIKTLISLEFLVVNNTIMQLAYFATW